VAAAPAVPNAHDSALGIARYHPALRSRSLLPALLAAAVLVPVAAAATTPPANPPRHHTKQDTAAARRLLLVRADLGESWNAGRTKLGALTCPTFDPPLKGIVETGAAGAANFTLGTGGPFVTQSAWIYRTAAQATSLWRTVVGKGLQQCLSDSVGSGSTQSVTFTVTGRRRLALPKLGARAAGYRVAAKAETTLQTVTVVYDLVVLGRGRAVTELSFASFSTPVSRTLELRLARRAVAKLAQTSSPKA